MLTGISMMANGLKESKTEEEFILKPAQALTTVVNGKTENGMAMES